MRDPFDDIFAPSATDPMEAARRAVRPELRRRFYKRAEVVADGGSFAVALDGRSVRTPARRPLAAPTHPLAEAIAAEWEAQTEQIEPARMPLTRLANTIIDGVTAAAPEIIAEIERYLGSDLVCYRAETPDRLIARQRQYWDPILAFARDRLGARFAVTEGVRFVPQPAEAVAAVCRAVPSDPWRLGAVHSIMTLTGSALTALAVAADVLSLDAAWTAAHVDEDWNMEQWGRDAIALERRAARLAEADAAAKVLALVPERQGA
jgi:chaperone required for assembly of F1-ATPase